MRSESLLLDQTPKSGVAADGGHREAVGAIAHKFRTGTRSVQLPEKPGSRRGVRSRPQRQATDGTQERVFAASVTWASADEDLGCAISVDSALVRAHQHTAEARTKGARPVGWTTMPLASPATGRPRRPLLPPSAVGVPPHRQAEQRHAPLSRP